MSRKVVVTCALTGGFIPPPDDPQKPVPGSALATSDVRMRRIEKLKPEICTLDCRSNF